MKEFDEEIGKILRVRQLPPSMIEVLQRTFLAGYAACFARMMGFSDLTDEQAEKGMIQLDSELREFSDDCKARLAQLRREQAPPPRRSNSPEGN